MHTDIDETPRYLPFISPVLKLIGTILIVYTFINYAFLAFAPNLPPQPTALDNLRQQVNFVSQMVDQGLVSLIGFVFWALSFWVDDISGSKRRRKFWRGLGFLVFLLSIVLGAVFLVMAPLHWNNAQLVKQQTVESIGKEVDIAEKQLNDRITAEVDRQRNQIVLLLKEPNQLKQAISSGQVSGEQAALLERFQQDPKAIDQFLESQRSQARNDAQTEIRKRKLTAESQSNTEFVRNGIRTGINSLLLAFGYALVGGMGFRELSAGPKA